MNVRFLAEAKVDLNEGFHFYQKREFGLGYDIAEEVDEAVQRITEDPDRWPRVFKKARRCRVHRFPYDIVFQKLETEIVIVAVAQLNRRPGYWKKRI